MLTAFLAFFPFLLLFDQTLPLSSGSALDLLARIWLMSLLLVVGEREGKGEKGREGADRF